MKTNCELPLCMLDQNNDLNDFDFILFHLMSNPRYRQWAYDQRRLHPERMMILDNSAYEFFVKGETLNMTDFVEYINDLQPDYYILPDILMDKEKTIQGIQEFINNYTVISENIFFPQPLAVAQGNSSKELIECLNIFHEMGIKYVGIPFHLSFFLDPVISTDISSIFRNKGYMYHSKDLHYAMGRVQWVEDNKEFLKTFEKVHFLGSHCPLEKHFYKEFESMDTGYPVKLGIEHINLFEEDHKPEIIIDDFLEDELTQKTKGYIIHNVNMFKQI